MFEGTSLFLKKYYGTGYTLSLTMSNTDADNRNNVLSTVQNHVPNASFKINTHDQETNELSIVLPTESSSTSVFPSMFQELQENQQALGIRTIGMSLTTLEEVFIK
jgi:ATP-binding cassette subfamily A (ABC1) protein 3